MGRLDVCPGFGIKAALRLGFAEDVIEFGELGFLQTELLAQLCIEGQGILQQIAIMGPDHFGCRSLCTPVHIEVFIGLFENDQGVTQPDQLAFFICKVLAIDAQPAGKHVRIFQQLFHRSG